MYRLSLVRYVVIVLTVCYGLVQAEPMVYKCKTIQGDFHYQKSPCADNSEAVASWTALAKPVPHTPEQSLTLNQGSDGHYLVDASVNDNNLSFVIDTGASLVALPSSLSFVNTLPCQDYAMMNTANGMTQVCTVTLAKLQFGSFLLENVTAVIMPHLSQALLGMNVLQQFSMEQHNGALRLSKHN